jgi:hypothetical protein
MRMMCNVLRRGGLSGEGISDDGEQEDPGGMKRSMMQGSNQLFASVR